MHLDKTIKVILLFVNFNVIFWGLDENNCCFGCRFV